MFVWGFGKELVEVLGHVVSNEGVSVDVESGGSVDWPVPTHIHDLGALLRPANF